MPSRYWRLDGLGGVDLLRADASTHRYARHSHEGYALGVVEAGAMPSRRVAKCGLRFRVAS
jgi:hypothetical protein